MGPYTKVRGQREITGPGRWMICLDEGRPSYIRINAKDTKSWIKQFSNVQAVVRVKRIHGDPLIIGSSKCLPFPESTESI